MPRYAIFGKYTPEALQAVREAGYASRLDALTAAVESAGGHVESLDFMSSAYDFDIMIRVDLPDSAAHFALTDRIMSTGVATKSATYELFDAAAADAAIDEGSLKFEQPDH